MLGAHNFTYEEKRTFNEYELPTVALMEAHNPAMVDIIRNATYALPTRLPDGFYRNRHLR